jgi:hypothetical protein
VSSAASTDKEALESSLCTSFECGKLPGRLFLKSCVLRDQSQPWALRIFPSKWFLQCLSGGSYQDNCIPLSERTPGDNVMFGASMELVRSAVGNVGNHISSSPGESEGEKD